MPASHLQEAERALVRRFAAPTPPRGPVRVEGAVLEEVNPKPVHILVAGVPERLAVRPQGVEIAGCVGLVAPDRRKVCGAFLPQEVDELTERLGEESRVVRIPPAVELEPDANEDRIAEVPDD